MKKLFSILTAVGLSLTATISTVACTNSKSNNNDSKVDEYEKEKELEEKQKNSIINGISDLLSDLKWEFTKDHSTHVTGEKSKLDITIGETDKKPNDHNKKYITIDNLTNTIRNNDQFSPWDTREIITAFALTKDQLPNDYKMNDSIKPGAYKWDPYAVTYVEGTVSIKHVDNGPFNDLVWKMGYLNKESYYVSLVDMAINAYFGGNVKKYEYNQYNPENAFVVKSGTEFNKEWINKNISDFITKGDQIFEKELINRLKKIDVQAYSLPIKGKPAEPIEGVGWNPGDSTSQYLRFNIKFSSRYDITFYIYLKPE